MNQHIPYPTTPSQPQSDEITREIRKIVDGTLEKQTRHVLTTTSG